MRIFLSYHFFFIPLRLKIELVEFPKRRKKNMNFLKVLFGGSEESPEEEKAQAEKKQFELMKYDGVKAMKIGQWDYASRCFSEALKVHDDIEIHEYLSRVYIRLDRMDEALQELRLLTDAEPQNIALWLQMAHVCYMQEDYAGMSEAAQRALSIEPDSAQAYYASAQAALGQDDVINGIARLTKAVSLEETMADARLLRAQTLIKMGDVKGAEEDSQWLLENVGEQEDVLLLAARVAHAKGEDDEALLIYNKVLDLNPFLAEAFSERGKIYYDRGDHQQAEADMAKALELNPQQMADVSGDYSAEGVEEKVKQAYSNLNPFGI